MYKFLAGFAVLILCALLASCATLSKAECEAGDWRSLGMSDGSRGLPLSQIDEHISACAKHQISVNRPLYEVGRTEGLKAYCHIDRAESDGKTGRPNYNSCTGYIGISFNRVYDKARIVYETGRELDLARGRVDSGLDRIVVPGLSDVQRAKLKGDIFEAQVKADFLGAQQRREERALRIVYAEEERRLAELR